jgi:hypothetical protein
MREYCTLFDSNYLVKALAMYRSLERHAAPFRLTAFVFDRRAEELLGRLALPALDVVPLAQLELHDTELAAVKGSRTAGEYCWTSTPALPHFLFETRPELSEVTYLDADLFFFSSPEPLFAELGDDAVLITPHRYAPPYAHHLTSGIYNVQFVTFRRGQPGLEVVDWWRERCLEWCYNRLEDGKFGDQKYLDDWTERFTGVHVLEHLGGGLAPWNALGHEVGRAGPQITVDGAPLVFFHFHGLRLMRNGRHVLHPAGYHVPRPVLRAVYAPYLSALDAAAREIRDVDPGFDAGFAAALPFAERIGRLRTRVGETVLRRFPAVARARYPAHARAGS